MKSFEEVTSFSCFWVGERVLLVSEYFKESLIYGKSLTNPIIESSCFTLSYVNGAIVDRLVRTPNIVDK